MVRRPLRPCFGIYDRTRLIEAMRDVNELAGLYQASSRKADPVSQECDVLRRAVHQLTTRLTGDPEYFSYRYSPPPPSPTPEELDGLATVLFNAYHQHPDNEPMAAYSEIVARGIRNEIEEWQAIRSALDQLPNTVYVALENMKRANTT